MMIIEGKCCSSKRLKCLPSIFFMLLLVLLPIDIVCPSPCHAQAAPGQPVKSEKKAFERIVLPNGVRLLIKPEPSTDQVAMSLFVSMEPDTKPDDPSVGELVARALFYGNTTRTQNGILTLANQAGRNIDVLRTPEYVAVTYVTFPPQLPEAMHLLCDCLKNADFAQESLQRALKTIQSERSIRHQDEFIFGYDTVCSQLGTASPSDDALRRVTQKQAQSFFHRRYLPVHTIISVVGPVDTHQIVRFFTAFLADYARPGNRRLSSMPDTSDPLISNNTKPLVTLKSTSEIAYAFIATPAPTVRSPDYPAFVVLTSLLGGGHASRLFRQARESLGIGYAVGTQFQPDLSDPLVTYLQWDPRRSKADVVKLLQSFLDGIMLTPPTEEEVRRARNFAIGQDALRHERVHERAFYAGWYEVLGLGYAYDNEFPHSLAAVTREQVIQAAKIYLGTRATVLITPNE